MQPAGEWASVIAGPLSSQPVQAPASKRRKQRAPAFNEDGAALLMSLCDDAGAQIGAQAAGPGCAVPSAQAPARVCRSSSIYMTLHARDAALEQLDRRERF